MNLSVPMIWELLIVLKNAALNGGFSCSRTSLFLESNFKRWGMF